MFDRITGLLSPDNSFFQFARKLIYVFALNFLFILTSIPLVTIGASTAAMNSVYLKIINEKQCSVLKEYFGAFKVNFLKSTIVWLIAVALGLLIYVDIYYWVEYVQDKGAYEYVMLVMSGVFALIFVMILHTIFPMISRFDMSVKDIIVNGTLITLRNILYCLEAVIFTVAIVGFSAYMILTGSFFSMVYMVLICFGLNGLVQSYIFRRVLNRYSEDYIESLEKIQEDIENGDYEF